VPFDIAHVSPHAWEAGGELNGYIDAVARELCARGHRVMIVASRFDFELTDAVALLSQLARLAKTIKLEPRLHDDRDPTYRVSCVLRSFDGSDGEVAAFERDARVLAVPDRENSLRFAHAS